MRSADIAAPMVLTGLGAPTRDGLGIALLTRQSARSVRRAGGRDAPNPTDERTVSRQSMLQLDYRALERLTVLVSIPYVSYRTSDAGGDQAAEGLGDASVLAKFSVWRADGGRELLVLGGAKLPTGSTTESDAAGSRLTAPQQPGSGTVDAIAGAALIWPWKGLTSYAEATYKLNTRRAYVFGNILAAAAGADYALPAAPWLSLRGAVQGEWIERDRSLERGPGVLGDGTVRDTGSRKLYLVPGLQLRPRGAWAITVSVAVPVYQHFGGTQLRDEPVWTFGVSTRLTWPKRTTAGR